MKVLVVPSAHGDISFLSDGEDAPRPARARRHKSRASSILSSGWCSLMVYYSLFFITKLIQEKSSYLRSLVWTQVRKPDKEKIDNAWV